MNINSGDALLTSIWSTDAVIADGTVYGADIPLEAAGRFLEGRVKVRFHITTAFTGVGNAELALYSGDSASPTTKIRTVWVGLKTDLTANTIKDVVLGTHEMGKYVRLGVINTGAATTGALKADLVAIA